MNKALFTVKVIYWCLVAYLPIAIDMEITNYMVTKCGIGSECLNHTMPLFIELWLINWAAKLLLWPVAAWNLGGKYIWLKFTVKYLNTTKESNA